MSFDNPWALTSGLLIGIIGVALLMYGKREQSPAPIVTGLVLCIAPYFIASLLVTWLFTAACLGGLYAISRHA
ncbi:MAG: hypothetical protein QM783_14305 [Phycisphaerales bacterium]